MNRGAATTLHVEQTIAPTRKVSRPRAWANQVLVTLEGGRGETTNNSGEW